VAGTLIVRAGFEPDGVAGDAALVDEKLEVRRGKVRMTRIRRDS
jgi:hypothetical protein